MEKYCEDCGKRIDDFDEEDYIFSNEHGLLNYGNFKKCLCGECACKAIDNEEEGVYFEVCDKCGKEFDYVKDSFDFSLETDGSSLIDQWDGDPLCAECAYSKWVKEM